MDDRVVVVVPGDGIGKIVVPEALRVLDSVGFGARYVEAKAGWDCWLETGEALPRATARLIEEHGVCLFGATTSAPRRVVEAEAHRRGLPPFVSPILEIRRRFWLDVSVRPCQSFPGNPMNVIRRDLAGGIVEPRVDVIVFRQNTEGLYSGIEWTNPPTHIRTAIGSHPAFAPYVSTPDADLALGVRVVTREAVHNLVEAAFAHAAEHGYESVTVCEKPNVLRETSGLFTATAEEVATAYPGIELQLTNIDAFVMAMIRRPEAFGVVATSNLFGDIVSDSASALVGGLGFVPSANLGRDTAVFEPVHGSAPDLSRHPTPIANPIAAILAAAMLLDHVGEPDKAGAVRAAVAFVVDRGEARTFDMLGLEAGPHVIAKGAASTTAMTDSIIAAILHHNG